VKSFLGFLWDLLLSPIASGIAALYLAVQGLIDKDERSVAGIVVAFVLLVVASVVSFARERTLMRRVVKDSLRIARRLTTLVADLGEISANNYHCWKTDLYIVHWGGGWSKVWPWIFRRRLVRRASVSLMQTVVVPDTPALLELGPIGLCFSEAQPQLWLDPATGITDPADIQHATEPALNAALAAICGAMRAYPVTNQLDQDLVGVLVVHLEPQFGAEFAGTLCLDQSVRRIRDAAVDLHELIRS
jgi:hypothetical protein